eukprot:CAMPEP_0171442016 /NCGR_PEP_ID=MMETSP0881-20121228/26934_1 /TAXON_ID=67004 /ORGANISM="Thalassiosira weissflogii, Strain CCMP1336" /LENGTH=89 /DNA_ID=CAMNT_0011964963 /DNA_START=51 /DNA_END=317 /DNA_ORIENTATION=+
MITCPAASFKAYYAHQPEDDDGNKNTKAFTDALDVASEDERIMNFTEDSNAILLTTNAEGRIQILHSSKALGAQWCVGISMFQLYTFLY